MADALALMKTALANPRPVIELYHRAPEPRRTVAADDNALALALVKDAIDEALGLRRVLRKAGARESLGSVYARATDRSVGVLMEIAREELTKSIDVCATISDDNEWRKVQDGVYTGVAMAGYPPRITLVDAIEPGEGLFAPFTKIDSRTCRVWIRAPEAELAGLAGVV